MTVKIMTMRRTIKNIFTSDYILSHIPKTLTKALSDVFKELVKAEFE